MLVGSEICLDTIINGEVIFSEENKDRLTNYDDNLSFMAWSPTAGQMKSEVKYVLLSFMF